MITAGPVRERAPGRVTDDDLCAVLILIAFAALACMMPAQADTFYHLRSGQQMWQTGHLLTREGFSWTAFGQPIANHWWLSQLAFYSLYSIGGPFALTLATGACAFLALFLSWRLTTGNAEMRLVLLIALTLTLPEWSVRPQAFSLLFTIVALRLVLADRLLLMLPLLVLWANAHAVVLLGTTMLGAAALDAVLWDRSRIVRATMAAIAGAVAPFVSPIGIRYWWRVLQTVQASKSLDLQEYRSAFHADIHLVPLWTVVIVFTVAAVRVLPALGRWNRPDRLLVLIAAIFAPMALASERNAAFFVLAAVPALSRLIPTIPRPNAPPPGRVMQMMTAGALVVATLVVAARWQHGGAALGWKPIAPAAVSAVRACPAPLYNTMYEGGALMWFVPQQRVFIDGRIEAYPEELFRRSRRADLDGDYKSLFSQYGIHCAVVGAKSPLAAALESDPMMLMRYSDADLDVFVQRGTT